MSKDKKQRTIHEVVEELTREFDAMGLAEISLACAQKVFPGYVVNQIRTAVGDMRLDASDEMPPPRYGCNAPSDNKELEP